MNNSSIKEIYVDMIKSVEGREVSHVLMLLDVISRNLGHASIDAYLFELNETDHELYLKILNLI